MDVILRNATIIDGCGSPRRQGDVGIAGGMIVATGEFAGHAEQEFDLKGLAAAPGFIDCHTHFDAQVMWDEMLTPSIFHGVTTAIAGNCGFSLAPLSGKLADAEYLISMLSRVEGMPLAALKAGVDPTWKSFGEYLDRIDGAAAINTAFLVGHCALRRCVMGERAVGSKATPEEIQAMAALLRRCLADGGVGFSTSLSPFLSDHHGDPIPSRWACDEELLTLAAVVKEFPGTWLEFSAGILDRNQYQRVTDLSLAAQRQLNWTVLVVDSRLGTLMEEQLGAGQYAAQRGAKVYALAPAAPMVNFINFRTGFTLDSLEGWAEFIILPDDRKVAAMRDLATRRRLEDGLMRTQKTAGVPKDFGQWLIVDLGSEKNARWKGRTVHDYAGDVGLSPFDALFQLAVEEDLELSFRAPASGADDDSWAMRARAWKDPYCLIGASDAGAHLDMSNTFAFSTQLLGEGVRRRGVLSLEEAVYRITGRLADVFGLTNRGRLVVGAAADIVVFDPDTIDCTPIAMRRDLPGNETRLYADAIGVKYVFVNGELVAVDNKATGRKGGKVLRSGRDTYTAPLN